MPSCSSCTCRVFLPSAAPAEWLRQFLNAERAVFLLPAAAAETKLTSVGERFLKRRSRRSKMAAITIHFKVLNSS